MKKLAVLLVGVMLFLPAFAGCGDSAGESDVLNSDDATAEDISGPPDEDYDSALGGEDEAEADDL